MEAEWWERINAPLDGLDDEQIERPGYTTDGWSIKDMLWHVAAWSEDAARVLGEMREGTWDGQDPGLDPGWTDRVNREWFERSRVMDLVEVREAWRSARTRMVEAFGAFEETTADADEWFEEAGPNHYAEHLPGLRSWVERLRSKPEQSR
jgi:hypothetical protein